MFKPFMGIDVNVRNTEKSEIRIAQIELTRRHMCLHSRHKNCMKNQGDCNNVFCFIASAETKRDWLIHGHVALDKCNVSLGQ